MFSAFLLFLFFCFVLLFFDVWRKKDVSGVRIVFTFFLTILTEAIWNPLKKMASSSPPHLQSDCQIMLHFLDFQS